MRRKFRFARRLTVYIKCKERSLLTPQYWILTVFVIYERAERLGKQPPFSYPNVHPSVYNSPSLDPILQQMNPDHTLTTT
jgi:hypothetical protein